MQYTSDDALAVAENKILMLYILEKVKKDIAYKVYLELVTTLTEINYFVFHETLEELIEEGYILKNEKIRYIDGDKTFDEVLKEGQESEWDKSLGDKEEKIIDIKNEGILLSNTRITLRKNISAKYFLNICEEVENTYRDNNIIIRAEEGSEFEVVIIFNENKKNFALDSIYVEAEKNAKVKLLYVFLGSGNQIIKHVTRVDEKAKVEISRNIFTSEKIKS